MILTKAKKKNSRPKKSNQKRFALIISDEPFFSRRSTAGLCIVIALLITVFVLIPTYNHSSNSDVSAATAAAEDSAIPALDSDATSTITELNNVTFDSAARSSQVTFDGKSVNDNIRHINELRKANGNTKESRAPLIASACLTGIAQNWARAYATFGAKVHNPNLKAQIHTNCSDNVGSIAENMGSNTTEQAVFNALTNSNTATGCGNRATIMDTNARPDCPTSKKIYPRGFGYIGVGAYRHNGKVFIVENFVACHSVSACRNIPPKLGAASTHPYALAPNESLKEGKFIRSGNGYTAELQDDGNLVIWKQGHKVPVGVTGAHPKNKKYHITFLGNGNLELYDAQQHPVWSSKTAGKGGKKLVIRNDGNLVIYTGGGLPVWTSKKGIISQSGCTNPFDGGWQMLPKVDQGVDYAPIGDQPVRAICDGVIKSTIGTMGSGWPGGVYIHYKITTPGPYFGKCIYTAEYLAGALPVGSKFQAGEQIAVALGANASTEWGWSYSPQTPVTTGDGATEGGKAFDRFIASLGGFNHGLGTAPTYPPGGRVCS